tara:strand:+ start:75 stop:566 length:492 start_codon:yes stop_codon:yes gene_type:complete
MTQVCWLSINPVLKKIDYYPKAIAMRIEKAYDERDIYAPSCCVLGTDLFNATIHFHHSGSCYQTTPGMSMGRAGFKQPGYRSVKRVIYQMVQYPHHFFCAIIQDIMKDPVTTIDNFTYERAAIEKWFSEHNTSPLTGLPLSSKVLVTNTVLFTQINDFIDSHK